MKVYISLPTNGRTDAEVKSMVSDAYHDIEGRVGRFDKDVNYVFSFTGPAPEGTTNPAIYQLYCSLELMANSDIVYFCPGWQGNLNCCMEQSIAEHYGIRCIYG